MYVGATASKVEVSMYSRNVFYMAALTIMALGCSSNDGNSPSGGGSASTSTGGTSSGATANGGATVTNGGATVTNGGATVTNGGATTSNGGASPMGGSVNAGGGATSNGGQSVGGAVTGSVGGAATGGLPASTGGKATSGGNTGKGGSAGKGGGAMGGANAGASARGGASVTGGAPSAGSGNVGAPACSVTTPAAATGVQNLTITVAGQERAYVLFVPTTYNGTTAMPLVFAWHGLGGSGTLARQYFGLERAASNGAIFVYPTGLANSSGQTAWTLTSNGIDVQLFDALRADVASKYCIDPNRVFSTGHSYGGMMTNALGCYRGNVLRAIAPVAGMPPFGNPTCTGPIAAFVVHGDNDATVDFTNGGVATRDLWIRLNTCSATATPEAVDPAPCVAYQDCSTGHPVHWCVHQNNHNWPSFAGAGIWGFFDSFK